jgi:hypothetical protein
MRRMECLGFDECRLLANLLGRVRAIYQCKASDEHRAILDLIDGVNESELRRIRGNLNNYKPPDPWE